jgi:hypothetical protein
VVVTRVEPVRWTVATTPEGAADPNEQPIEGLSVWLLVHARTHRFRVDLEGRHVTAEPPLR